MNTDKPTTTASATPDKVREYYEIQNSDIGRALISAFGRKWSVCDFIGRIMARDVGKRVYRFGDVLQVENDEQRAKRTASATPDKVREQNPIFGKGLYIESKHEDAKELARLGIAYGDKRTIPAEKRTWQKIGESNSGYFLWKSADEKGNPIYIYERTQPSETSGGYYSAESAAKLKNLPPIPAEKPTAQRDAWDVYDKGQHCRDEQEPPADADAAEALDQLEQANERNQ